MLLFQCYWQLPEKRKTFRIRILGLSLSLCIYLGMLYVTEELQLQNITLQQIWLKEIGHYDHKTLEIISFFFALS